MLFHGSSAAHITSHISCSPPPSPVIASPQIKQRCHTAIPLSSVLVSGPVLEFIPVRSRRRWLGLTRERGAAWVLTPGVSWVCAQAADPHITSNPGFGCPIELKKLAASSAILYFASRLSKVNTSPAVSVFWFITGLLPFRNTGWFDMSRRNSKRLMMWCAINFSKVVVNSLK